jgi:hypothetical protein
MGEGSEPTPLPTLSAMTLRSSSHCAPEEDVSGEVPVEPRDDPKMKGPFSFNTVLAVAGRGHHHLQGISIKVLRLRRDLRR